MRTISTLSAVLTLGLWVCGCSGSSYGNGGNTGNPNAPTPNTPGVVTVNVVAINGAQSFSPNPATLPAGTMIVWHNVNNVTHRVVLNDGSLDTGNLDPGASSQPMAMTASGAQYHCAIHPVMIGSINQPTQPTSSSPPCHGQYCN
jgi:plastocyanin